MTDKQDPIANAARLLREAAEELRQAHTLSSDRNNWIGEPEAKAAYDEHMAAAQALEDWEAAVGAGGVQTLSAAPAVAAPAAPTPEHIAAMERAWLWMDNLADQQSKGGHATFDLMMLREERDTLRAAIDAARKAAPGVGNSGFDHQTASDFLSGKTVSDEAVRKFVQAARWAHDEKAALSAMLLSVRGVLASREAEIALLKKALMEAEAAPQQEAQEPWGACVSGRVFVGGLPEHARKLAEAENLPIQWLYTAPQPAPAPMSDDSEDAARWRMLPAFFAEYQIDAMKLYRDVDAALAAQGGKV